MYSRVSVTIEIETWGLTQAFTAELLSTCSQMVNYFDHFYVVSTSCAVSKYTLVQTAGKSEFESKTICNCEKKEADIKKKKISDSLSRFSYHKIPKISSGAYIFQRPFLRGLFLEGLIFRGAYLRREICVSKSVGLAL